MLKSIKNKILGLKKVPPPVETSNLKEGIVSFSCDKCFCKIETNFAARYSCSECVEFDLCENCYQDEKSYYDNLKTPGSNPRKLPEDYKLPKHSDYAKLPHFMTFEKKNQYLLVHELKGETVFESIQKSFEYFKDRKCLGLRKKVEKSDEWPLGLGDFEWLTYSDFHKLTLALANSFSNYIKPQELIGIYMDNCLEWYVSDFAALWCSMSTVPLHHSSTHSALYEILLNSELSIIVCSKETIGNVLKLFQEVESSEKLKKLIKLIVMREDDYDRELLKSIIPSEVVVKSYKELIEFGQQSNSRAFEFKPRKPDDISCISYTSGSTGSPKGVVHLDKFFNNHLIRSFVKYPTCILSFATLAHSQRLSDWKYLFQGGRIGIYSGSYDYLFDDLKLLRVHALWGVPRFWNFIYSQFQSDLQDEIIRNLQLEKPIPEDELYHNVIIRFSSMFGNRIRTLVTGGAPTSQEVLTFMNKCWPTAMVSNSYGLTEAIGIMVDGYISDEVEFRIDPVPEFGYHPTDKPYPRGELVVKTETMSSGYYKNEELTNQSFDKGWFRTGDVVELVGNRKIKIIDRKKNAFKLSNGEFVTPEPLENIFLGSNLISQIFIYGNITKQFLVAIIKPSKLLIDQVKEKNQQQQEFNINTNESIKIKLMKEINEIAKQKNLPNYEIPKIISIDDTEWNQANGLITGSGKYSRNKLAEYYNDIIDEMYENIEKIQIELRKDNRSGAIENYIKSVLNITNTDEIDLSELSFTQIGGDSLGAVKLSNILKEKENIDISPSLILNQNINLSNISKLIVKKEKSTNTTNTTKTNSINKDIQELKDLIQVDWDKEFELSNDIIPISSNEFKQKPMIDKLKGNNILLTGCTGYLGANILYGLLQSKDEFCDKVYCVMRNIKTKEDGIEQIKKIFSTQLLPELTNSDLEKIEPLIGDLSKPLLGFTESTYKDLSEKIDIILHNGAIVNMVLPYQNMKSTNVESTKDLLKLSTLSERGKMKFIYVSTIGVFINKLTPVINEFTVPSQEFIQYSTGYNQSKLVSDTLVREAAERGLPVMLFRPGTIYCHSETGFDNQVDFVGFIIKSILLSKSYPKLHSDQGGHFNLSPVNWVSDSLLSIIKHQDFWHMENQNPQIFHMVNENSLHIDKLCEYIQATLPLKSMNFQDWKSLQFSMKDNVLAPVQHLLEGSDRLPGFENFLCPRTKKYLNQIGKSDCLRVTKELVTKNIKYLSKELNL